MADLECSTCKLLPIQRRDNINEVMENSGLTPLINALNCRCYPCTRELIESGADVNLLDSNGNTPLTFAISEIEMVQLLLKAGADVNQKSHDGDTALFTVTTVPSVSTRMTNILELLLQSGADVNQKNNFDRSPLMMAAENGLLEFVNILLKKGALINTVCCLGNTPLSYAAHWGYDHVVQRLLEVGADINTVDNKNNTPLIATGLPDGMKSYRLYFEGNNANFIEGCTKCVKILLQAGAVINKINEDGFNALQCYIVTYCDYDDIFREANIILFTAGEILHGTRIKNQYGDFIDIPDYLRQEDLKTCLKHLCRKATRDYLIHMNPHAHLFGRIPKLGLPPALESYLLYDKNLSL